MLYVIMVTYIKLKIHVMNQNISKKVMLLAEMVQS
jgi:hypothetical protein